MELARVEYQLPRLTRMWNHLERQVGGSGSKGAVKGMGEKQIEIDKRLLRKKISSIKRELDEVGSLVCTMWLTVAECGALRVLCRTG